uniref:Uncharacterized protein n=1 Tax=Rhizophora mucronata TaxID=61149 RepID=A0A2P2J6K5_RHIMU
MYRLTVKFLQLWQCYTYACLYACEYIIQFLSYFLKQ